MRSLGALFGRKTYKQTAATTRDTDQLIAGDGADRLSGLESVLAQARGATLLDVGCHDGGVPEAFAKAGAVRVDGCDIAKHAIARAKARFEKLDVPHDFRVCDLSEGGKALSGFSPKYDIVCYLGVHHHLSRQMEPATLRALTAEIAKRASKVLVTRTPEVNFPTLHEYLTDAGLEPASELIPGPPGVGPVRIYRPAATTG